jgi:hypothetical protein
MAGPAEFKLKALFEGGLVATDRQAVLDFEQQSAALQRAVLGANKSVAEITDRLKNLKAAAELTPGSTEDQALAVRELMTRVADLNVSLNGDVTISSRQENIPMSITSRVNDIVGGQWESQADITKTHRQSYAVATEEFTKALADLRAIANDLVQLEKQFDAEGAPWTPGRLPDWPER